MKVRVLLVGKNKLHETGVVIEHYIRRISRYCSLSVEFVQESRADGKSKEKIIARESELLQSKLRSGEFSILLDVEGELMGSVEFAGKIEDLTLHGKSNISFIIGGSYGVSQELADRVNMKLSLSKMTMSHQVVRLMFVEQLYRAFTILRNEPYHH